MTRGRSAQMPRWRRWVLHHTPGPVLQEPTLLFLAFLCVISAAMQLAGTGEPATITALMPRWLVLAWNGELILGGLLTLAGILARRSRLAVYGLVPLGCAALAYAVVIGYVAGQRGALAAGITAVFALTCFVKAFVLSTATYPIQQSKGDGC